MNGVSNFNVEELDRARAVGEIVSVQDRFNLVGFVARRPRRVRRVMGSRSSRGSRWGAGVPPAGSDVVMARI
jgi:hypothetical protein